MTLVYILLFILPIVAELSPQIPTEGIVKKIWLALVSVGALVALGGGGSDLINYGVLLYLVQTLYYNLKFHHRRKPHYGKTRSSLL